MKRGPTRSTLVVTNVIKLGGFALGMKTGFTTQDTPTLVLAAFMMAGAQGAESVALAFIERFFGLQEDGKK